MKYTHHLFPMFFYCKLDEKNSIRLVGLNSNENKYSFNINCKLKIKLYNLKFFCKIPIKKISKVNSFIDQYF
jgi:hypothetical protein